MEPRGEAFLPLAWNQSGKIRLEEVITTSGRYKAGSILRLGSFDCEISFHFVGSCALAPGKWAPLIKTISHAQHAA
jgi:hypothetical protein